MLGIVRATSTARGTANKPATTILKTKLSKIAKTVRL
jgi:hypothetical protein